MAADEVRTGSLGLVERYGLGRGHESEGRVEFAGLEARLRRG
jgi:hypothetical protein